MDIIDELIENNIKEYGTDKIKFKVFDGLIEKINNTDLIICRDFLFHLSWEHTKIFFDMLLDSGSKYLLTTTFPEIKNNTDLSNNQKNSGWGFRKINVELEPYNLKNSMYEFTEITSNRKMKLYDIR